MDTKSAYMKDYMKKRYAERRQFALAILGGKCAECGSTETLEFDHINKLNKELTFERMTMVSSKRFLAELAKGQLLCDKCHNKKTLGERNMKPAKGTHGTLSAYRYCKCEECKKANREWKAKYKQSKAKVYT